MLFEKYIQECMGKLNEEVTIQSQPATAPQGQPAAPQGQTPPPATPDQQQAAPVDLTARKQALIKKLTDKINTLTDVNAITELEKIQ